MICSRLLLPLNDVDEYKLIPLVRTIEFTIYAKASKIKHDNEVLLTSISNNLSQYDIDNFHGLYCDINQAFVADNQLFDEETEYQFKFSNSNDEDNYQASYIIQKLIKKLLNFVNDEDFNYCFIIMTKIQNNIIKPFYIYCNPEDAKKELEQLFKTLDNTKYEALLLEAANTFSFELKKFNEEYLNKSSWFYNYIHNQMSLWIEKANDIIFEKLKNN
ncbi:hypothetical protein HU155_00505 [Metamycoplasma hominis]|uniref:hypothetical protein n=1 Tax=Metamycoplasma hominis TaxID=2098 RepID=UPI001592DC0F|nr:hypothetical protein [Metamycoplasma hominis]QKX37589.1 hypothetical protein HU155_00505 [Metamycoplasma hominis]